MNTKIFGIEIHSPNLEAIGKPLLVFIFVFGLLVFGVKTGFEKIMQQRAALQKANATEKILKEKESNLREVQRIVNTQTDAAVNALPPENSSLAVISQLKSIAGQNLVAISGFKSMGGGGGKETLRSLKISFSVNSNTAGVIAFLKSLNTIAPLVNIDKVELKTGTDQTQADILISCFWSNFPSKIPSVTQPLVDLNDTDKQILNEVSKLNVINSGEVLVPTNDSKSDPFAF